MTVLETDYYKIGGTLAPTEPSYVYRTADNELYENLRDGKFCYVLTSRQMGKSSLLNRTAMRLKEEGVVVAELDLTSIGQNLTLEQWYDGLVYEMGRRLGVKRELRKAWEADEQLGPLHRFLGVLRDGILANFTENVVIFIDEIEVVRSLPFSTDEFFAAIRECYNRRANDSEMNRLTFALFGMATPQDLIKDTRITPFNIGKRIELADFTFDDARQLSRGMSTDGRDGARLLKRVLYWSSGQPYLTQRLCHAIAGDTSVTRDRDVDKLCHELFLTERARQSEANLVPLREFLLRSSSDRAGLLDLYTKILTGKHVVVDPTDTQLSILQLSGVTQLVNGRLRIRNRIYRCVFDKRWIRANMPDAELQRQRAAARKAVLQASAFYGAIILVMGWLVWFAGTQEHAARRSAQKLRQNLFVSDINLAKEALDKHDVEQTESLLDLHKDDPEAHCFAYNYLYHMSHREYFTTPPADNTIYSVDFSPDGKYLAVANSDGVVTIWDFAAKRAVATIDSPGSVALFDRYSPDGKQLVLASANTITVFSTSTWTKKKPITCSAVNYVTCVAYSTDGRYFAVGGLDGTAVVYNTDRWSPIRVLKSPGGRFFALSFIPDRPELAAADNGASIHIWSIATGKVKIRIGGNAGYINALACSHDGRMLAAGGAAGAITVYDTSSGRIMHVLANPGDVTNALCFDPATNELVAADADNAINFWDVASETMTSTLDGHRLPAQCLAFSPNGRWLASAGWDFTAKVWDTWDRSWDVLQLKNGGHSFLKYRLSPDSLTAIALRSSEIRQLQVWRTDTGSIVGSYTLGERCEYLALAEHAIALVLVDSIDLHHSVAVYDDAFQRCLWRVPIPSAVKAKAIAISADGRLVAAEGSRNILIWSDEGRSVTRLAYADSQSPSIVFSPDGSRLAVCDQDSLSIINVRTGKVDTTLLAHGFGAAFSPDGETIAVGDTDGTVSFWDIATDRVLLTLQGHGLSFSSVAFAPEADTVRMIAGDGTVTRWTGENAQTGR